MANSVIKNIIARAFKIIVFDSLTDLNIDLGNNIETRLYTYSYRSTNKPSINGGYMLTIGNNDQGFYICFTYADAVTIYVRKVTEGTMRQWTRISTT